LPVFTGNAWSHRPAEPASVQDIISDSFSLVGQTIRERSLLLQGEVAFVFGTADLRFARARQPETKRSLRYTAGYVRRDRQWRMLVLRMQGRSPA